MKVDEMERLLAAYYEGTTDEHEENRLKEALCTEDVPEHLESDRRLLVALECWWLWRRRIRRKYPCLKGWKRSCRA